MSRKFLLCIGLALILSGCTAIAPKMEPPEFSLAGLELVDADFFEQRFRFKLRVINPNDFALPIKAVNYRIEVNDEEFASGVSNKPVTIPAYGTELLEVDGYSNFFRMLKHLKDTGAALRGKLTYRLKGAAVVGDFKQKIPFERKGELDLINFTRTSR
jgi:LEA14-like dessication related protein